MNKFRYFIIILSLILLSSCNLLVSPPLLRENANDEQIQISGFTAVPTSDTSITTIWNWAPPQDWMDYDERVEKINILHSTLGYPGFTIPFAGETFTDRNKWEFQWENLDSSKTHYFSLFAKTGFGDWVPVYKVKVMFPGTSESGVMYSRDQAFNIDNAGMISWNQASLSVSNSQWAVISFNFPKDVYIVNAVITISVTALTEITFAPLDGFPSNDDMTKWNQLLSNTIVREDSALSFSSNLPAYDITNVVRAAMLGPLKAILIKTTDGSNFTIDNNASAPFITADIIK